MTEITLTLVLLLLLFFLLGSGIWVAFSLLGGGNGRDGAFFRCASG